jgi:hypothetical protein
MLQKNLFAIMIASFVLVLTGSAFGQWHPEIDKIKSPRDVATGQIKSPRDVSSGQASGLMTETTIPAFGNQRVRAAAQYNPKEIGVDKAVNRKGRWEMPEMDADKNVFARPRNSNPGDTATHERRRKN